MSHTTIPFKSPYDAYQLFSKTTEEFTCYFLCGACALRLAGHDDEIHPVYSGDILLDGGACCDRCFGRFA